jgi:hypothetical protein
MGNEGISFSGRIDCPASHTPCVADSESRDMIAHSPLSNTILIISLKKLNNTSVQLKLIRIYF